MIGKTNIPMGVSKGETVSILLKTNQSSNEDLNGVKVVVSYDDESHEYTYNGQFSVEIPKDKTYTVTFGEVDGYKTPSSVTYTAVKGFSRSIEVTYYGEKVTVNVSAEGGASVDGQSVIVEIGVPSEGVYIEDTSYKLWTVEEWDDSATANSIVVSDGSMAKRVSLVNGSEPLLGRFYDTSTLPAIGTQEEAELDMNGKENTSLLKKIFMSTTYEYKQNYELYYAPYNFPDGSIKGYVPSLGELIFLYEYNSEINSALEKCGAEAIKHSGGSAVYGMYSSTVRTNSTSTSDATMWIMYWDQGAIYRWSASGGNSGGCMVRYMADYSMPYPITNNKASFSVPYDETYTVSLSDMDGYTAPELQTYTASQPTREISMEYKKAVEHVIVNVSSDDNIDMDGYKVYVRPNVANGVYIQGVDGNLYTESEWDTMKVANGIAVVTDECSFVIALEDVASGLPWSAQAQSSSLTVTTDESVALLDFNGVGNTSNMILTEQEGIENAAKRCSDYLFPNGQSGYLGAAGEWGLVSTMLEDVNNLLSIAGGRAINGGYEIWTSTQYNYSRAWTIDVLSYSLYYRQITDYLYSVRAFAELGSSYTITNGKVEFDVSPGVEYTISVEDIDGYTTPEPQSFVAESGTRTVNMVYEAVKLGVFIATHGGQLVSPDIWTSSNGIPVGVALITYNSSYIIGLDATQKGRIAWSSNASIDLSNVPTSTNSVTIATYYDGVSYTDAMIAAGAEYNTTSYAAGYVRSKSISFGGNILTGYLGSAGEWQDALNNYQAIMDAFAKIGDTFATDGNGFLTSCEFSSQSCWYAYWVSRNPLLQLIDKSATVYGLYVVPFFKI